MISHCKEDVKKMTGAQDYNHFLKVPKVKGDYFVS